MCERKGPHWFISVIQNKLERQPELLSQSPDTFGCFLHREGACSGAPRPRKKRRIQVSGVSVLCILGWEPSSQIPGPGRLPRSMGASSGGRKEAV